jgi:glyoxylase I family protein
VPEQRGVGHITLTVTDVERSAGFYNQLFGGQILHAGEDAVGSFAVMASSSLRIGFRRHQATDEAERFEPSRVGLDHLGIHVDSKEQLKVWLSWLNELGVPNSGIIEDPWGYHLNATDPDGIALEFFAAVPQD